MTCDPHGVSRSERTDAQEPTPAEHADVCSSVAADWSHRQRDLWERRFDVVDDYLKEDESR